MNNYMECIAAMFDKKLGEHFKVKFRNIKEPAEVFFDYRGIIFNSMPETAAPVLLNGLLIGEVEIVEE